MRPKLILPSASVHSRNEIGSHSHGRKAARHAAAIVHKVSAVAAVSSFLKLRMEQSTDGRNGIHTHATRALHTWFTSLAAA